MRLTDCHKAAGVVFAAAMAAYLLTMCPTIYSGDSGDLISASYSLGVAHPTGYPLYMILGKVFSILPFGAVAYRYNLMSAVFAALAAVFACLCARMLTKSWAAAVGVGLLTAFSASLWGEATVADVRTLNGFFSVALVYLALRWRERRKSRDFIVFCAVLGLSLTHHVSTLVYLPAFAYIIAADNRRAVAKVDVRGALAALFAPLLLYLYLPLRAQTNPAYNWGNPSTPAGFLNHISGAVHRQAVVLTLTSTEFFDRFWGIVYDFARQFSLPGMLVLWGLYGHGGKNRVFLNFTGLMVAGDVIYTMFLNDVPMQVTTFCIPSIIILGIWAGFAYTDVFRWLKKKAADARWQYVAVAAAALIVLGANYYGSDKSENLVAYDFGTNLLKTVDRNGVIFAEGDNVVFPLSYLQIAEKMRPDVRLVDRTGVLSQDVYGADYFYLSAQKHLERQFNSEYDIVKSGRPVYYAAPPDLVFPGYTFKQTGLMYRVVREGETPPEANYWDRYTIRQVRNSTIYRDYMTMNIVSVYYIRLAEEYADTDKDRAISILRDIVDEAPDSAPIRYQIGTLLLAKGDYNGAIAEFQKVLVTDPKNPKVHNNLGTALNKLGKRDSAKAEYALAISYNPYYLVARNNLAVTLINESKYAEAADQYKSILKIDPTFSRAYFDLGRIYYTTSHPHEAALLWRKYLELEPNDPYAADIAAKISEIENTTQNMTGYAAANATTT